MSAQSTALLTVAWAFVLVESTYSLMPPADTRTQLLSDSSRWQSLACTQERLIVALQPLCTALYRVYACLPESLCPHRISLANVKR